MRGRGNSVRSKSQRQFHHVPFDRVFCTSQIIKERNTPSRQVNRESKQNLFPGFSPSASQAKRYLSWGAAGSLLCLGLSGGGSARCYRRLSPSPSLENVSEYPRSKDQSQKLRMLLQLVEKLKLGDFSEGPDVNR